MHTIFTFLMVIIMSLQPWLANASPSSIVGGTNDPVAFSRPADALGVLASSSFPTTGILDSFDRSNGSIGGKWSIDSSHFKVLNNQLSVVSEGMIFWNAASFGADQEAYVTFVKVDPIATNMDLLLKSQSAVSKTSLLEVSYKPAKKVIGITSYTTAKGNVAYCSNISATFSTGDQLGARATADGQVYVYKNGTMLAVCNVTAWPDYAKGGYVGLLSWGSTNPIYDNFGGGTNATSATVTPLKTQTKTNTPKPTATRTPVPTATSTLLGASTQVLPPNTPQPNATWKVTQTLTSTTVATNTPIPPIVTSTAAAINTPVPPTTTTTPTVAYSPTRTQTATISSPTPTSKAVTGGFRFISWGDAQDATTNLTNTANQAKSLNPAFTIFNGDLENDGVVNDRMTAMTGAFGSLYASTFLVRGNHDDHVTGSAAVWESFFEAANRPLPAGVTNYVALNSTSTYLTYSFDYGNSRFIGLDAPGDFGLVTSAEFTFLDARLTDAENLGLTHAFLFWHGPEYCVESVHCSVSSRTSTPSTNMAKLVTIINKHPIVTATFHGHEHILGWVHMDSSRVTTLTRSYEEFITSPSGGSTYNSYIYPARMDYYYPTVPKQGFAAIDVNGSSFTYSIYLSGNTSPVWSKTFSKSGAAPANTAVPPTRIPLSTATRTLALTATRTAGITTTPVPPAATKIATPAASPRSFIYYLADRVRNNADFAKLASWGINTAVVDFNVNGSSTTWKAVFTEAAKYNINIVIWPSDWNNRRPNCDWAAPFPVSANGDITKVKPLLDVASQYPNFIGIVNGHESFWTCTNMTFDEMAGLKTQLKAYALSKGRAIKVWNYINSLYSASMFPDNQISRVMDVAVTWKHCAGNAEGSCDVGSSSALAQINNNRARLAATGLDGTVELVYIMQTFTTSGSYVTKFTLSQLENYSCEFLNTSALDGFGFYTWDAGWWPDLHGWTDLQPAVPYIHNTCTH